jgi:L-serine dehydratase
MAGVESFVPFDQVVEAMAHIGTLISPKLRETSLGGLAVTATAKAVEKKLGISIGKKASQCEDCEGCD